jgi:uncharacterized membrane protein
MSKTKKSALLFVIGGVGYGIIELIWRGRTHPTMILAGGICFLAFSKISLKFETKPLLFKALLSATVVTAVELVFGIIFNVIFKMHVWDYSTQPFNLFGQICLKFSFAWLLLGLLFVPLAEAINKKIMR